jgi:hypothetical protein
MRQLVYALRFTGQATPVSADGSVLAVATTASCEPLGGIDGTEWLACKLEGLAGGEAHLASELTITGVTSFQEVGTIAFGESDRLRFSTVGSGYLGPSPDPSFRHGAVVWRVDGGESQFAGAGGLITSNFLISSSGDVTDHHFGVIFLR